VRAPPPTEPRAEHPARNASQRTPRRERGACGGALGRIPRRTSGTNGLRLTRRAGLKGGAPVPLACARIGGELPASAGQLPVKNAPPRTPRKERPAKNAGPAAGPSAGPTAGPAAGLRGSPALAAHRPDVCRETREAVRPPITPTPM